MAKNREVNTVVPNVFHGDYGDYNVPIISSVVEGPHGYCGIIGPNEVPSGMEKMSGLTSAAGTRTRETGK